MSYDVSTLGEYTQTNEKTLLVKAIYAARTVAKLKAKGRVLTGVKSKFQVPALETDAIFQDGKGCGFNPLGTTKITTREGEVGVIKVNEALCPADVEATFEQLNLSAGSDYTDIIFAKEYSEQKALVIAKTLEKLIWKGDKASADAALKRIDGLIKIIDAATGVVNGNTGGVTAATGITKTNVVAILDAMYLAIPEDVIENEDNVIVCGGEVFRAYIMAMRDKNYFKDFKLDGSQFEVTIAGTNVTLVSTPGLNGTNRLFGFNYGNIVFATDLLNEEDQFELKYAEEADEVRYKAKFKAGVDISFPTEIVSFKLVP